MARGTRGGGSLTQSADRTVAVGAAAVRTALLTSIRSQGFSVTSEQLTVLEATRGSQLAGGALMGARLPLWLSVRLSDAGTGCAVRIDLADRWRSPTGTVYGAQSAYRTVFADVVGSLDDVLRRLDPTVVGVEPLPPPAPGGLLERSNELIGSWGSRATARADDLLSGPRPDATPTRWRGVGDVVLVSPAGAAVLPVADLQAMLTAGALVVGSPGALPDGLTADVERLVTRLEQALDDAGRPPGGVRIDLVADEVPVVTFLRQQARIRESLPLRTRQVCTTCRLEKVLNPDYQRLQTRNRRLRGLLGGVGGAVSSSGITPYVLIGRLVQTKQLEPDFVCTRCQGLEATSTVVTFCPNCGERRDEVALRSCRRCRHDFRTALPDEHFWHPVDQVLAPEPPVPPVPPPAAPTWAPPVAAAVPAGWYPDADGVQRWWDGAAWTWHTTPSG